jgi:hypothetical protein
VLEARAALMRIDEKLALTNSTLMQFVPRPLNLALSPSIRRAAYSFQEAPLGPLRLAPRGGEDPKAPQQFLRQA